LDHVLARFVPMAEFAGIVVAIAQGDTRFMDLEHATHAQVTAIVGGMERQDSVHAGLTWLTAQGAADTDWVFVHDAARPLLTHQELHALLEATRHPDCPGCVLGVPAADTLKRADMVSYCPDVTDAQVADTLDRSGLWHAMTPQVFRLGPLQDAIEAMQDAEQTVTDESQAMEAIGVRPWLIRGRRSNLKLTYPEDFEVVESVLSQRMEDAT
jgi:2-C-methyl-D-erythritol 4-phosphate cytidylyltransferase